MFKGRYNIDTKNKLLSHLTHQINLGLSADKFNFKGYFFCKEALSKTTDIRKCVFLKVLADFSRHASP